MRFLAFALVAVAALIVAPAGAEEVVNLYSSRHYNTDERLYSDFTKLTGIKVNRIEDDASALIERIKAEGAYSPADVFLTADVGRLHHAEEAGLLKPVQSPFLSERVPAHLRHPEGKWFGFSTRARIIFYDKASIDPARIRTYADLAAPANKGLVCTRSSNNVYMISLLASIVANEGEAAAEAWAKGVWDNRAREPAGGDTDQLKGIVSGECGIALANSYYYARAFHIEVPGLKHPDDTSKIGVVFPNQSDRGTHVNISGGAVLVHAPHAENAVKFLEYLGSDSAQTYFAAGNSEYPVVAGIAPSASIAKLGAFKADTLPLAEIGKHQAKALAIYQKVGFK